MDSKSCIITQKWFENLLTKQLSGDLILTKTCAILHRTDVKQTKHPQHLLNSYLTLSKQMGIGNPKDDSHPRKPYNLLITPSWMALIRRKVEEINGFSVNGLGFAGYLLATNKSNLNWLYENVPEKLLEELVI